MWGQDIELQLQHDHEQQQRRQQQLQQQRRYEDEEVSDIQDDFDKLQEEERLEQKAEGGTGVVAETEESVDDDEAVEVDISGLLSMEGLFERVNSQTDDDDDTIPPPPPSSHGGGDIAEEIHANKGSRLVRDDDSYPTKDKEGILSGRSLKLIVTLLCLAILFCTIGLSIALTRGKRGNEKSGTGTPSVLDDPTADQLTSTESSVVPDTTNDDNAPPPECGEVLTVDTTCFAPEGGSIEIFFTECGTIENLDWLGLYPSSFDPNDPSGLDDGYLLWVYACDNGDEIDAACQPSLIIEFASGSQIPTGSYRFVYFKNNQLSAPYTGSSYSQELQISEACQ